MHELSHEDPSTQRVTDKKISLTFRELGRNTERGKIVVFEKAKAIIGYAILIPYWSNDAEEISCTSMSCTSNQNAEDAESQPVS